MTSTVYNSRHSLELEIINNSQFQQKIYILLCDS